MVQGVRYFLATWWRQPFDFDWTAKHLRSSGLLKTHQVFIGLFCLTYGLTALLTVMWGYVHRPGLVLVVAATSALLGGLRTFRPWPSEQQSAVFATCADVAVVVVILCCMDAFTAMPGLALLAANGVYIVVVHGPRALLAHLLFTVAAMSWSIGLAIVQASAPLTVIAVRALVLTPTVVGVPIIVQTFLLSLRVGAADALYDPLTRLHNRRGLEAHLRDAVSSTNPRWGVLAIDIDGLKTLNDRYGHDAGDRALVALAEATRHTVSALAVRSIIARTGGDEFVVLINASHDTTTKLAAQLHAAIARADTTVTSTLSIGAVNVQVPNTGIEETVRTALRHADEAMYRAKNSGGNQTIEASGADPAPTEEPVASPTQPHL